MIPCICFDIGKVKLYKRTNKRAWKSIHGYRKASKGQTKWRTKKHNHLFLLLITQINQSNLSWKLRNLQIYSNPLFQCVQKLSHIFLMIQHKHKRVVLIFLSLSPTKVQVNSNGYFFMRNASPMSSQIQQI